MISLPPPDQASSELAEALDLMTHALAILDNAGAPGSIGSALDLAIARLAKQLGRSETPIELGRLIAQVELSLSETGSRSGHES